MSSKGKCDWCGLVFDFVKHKPKLRIKDTGDLLCESCAEELKSNDIEEFKLESKGVNDV